jgi:hypothetical protein
MNCVRRHGEPLVDDPTRLDNLSALGIDEHKMLSANGEHHTEYVTCFVDVKRGCLLDIVRGRNADDVGYWLSQGSPAWRQAIDAVAIDPHRGYLKGILAYLPDTTVTVDCFHGIKLANSMVDDIRRRVQQESLGHRGRREDPLFKTRRLMTRGWERLSDRQRDKLLRSLDAGDPDGECGAGILGKELFREMYAARNLHAARWRLVAFYQHAAEADVPELTRLAKTVSTWEEEILNYHVTGISNGPTEAQNLIAEKLRRISVYRPSVAAEMLGSTTSAEPGRTLGSTSIMEVENEGLSVTAGPPSERRWSRRGVGESLSPPPLCSRLRCGHSPHLRLPSTQLLAVRGRTWSRPDRHRPNGHLRLHRVARHSAVIDDRGRADH